MKLEAVKTLSYSTPGTRWWWRWDHKGTADDAAISVETVRGLVRG